MAINIPYKGGSDVLPRLAPDLTWPSAPATANVTYVQVLSINATGGLTTALSLTGKYAVSHLAFINMTAETVTVKMTVDDVVIWNDTFTSGNAVELFGSRTVSGAGPDEVMMCEKSLLLEVQTATDTDIRLNYVARPIL
ncbi:MAG: hypothetical protein Unbinned6354contig1000_1 [Prokaryotic dsDNA virus sp.]|nr:hypothetical protein [Cytophagaceae bacterium]QDP54298.1 MAG: hypothetical protein Unbinned6354contig1000_1 [Prokaryotic dsDNA virus sp.]|tara:strand:+ start:2842 stop:3258 length:417 start_codon:yes stop_codon:yes gene_type:complete